MGSGTACVWLMRASVYVRATMQQIPQALHVRTFCITVYSYTIAVAVAQKHALMYESCVALW